MGMMKRRQSRRRRGARVISDMRRPLADDFVKCKRPAQAAEDAEFCFASLRGSASRARDASQYPVRSGNVQRRPLGVRLWLADLAAPLRVYRTSPGAADRRAPRALRLFVRSSRAAGKTPAPPLLPPPRRLPPPPVL